MFFVKTETKIRLHEKQSVDARRASADLRRMHKNKVRTTLARRLLVGIYVVLARGEVFSLERCLGMA